MALIKCSRCGREISDKAKTCPQCGQPVVLESAGEIPKICKECGLEISEDVEVCPRCGCPISENGSNQEEAPQKVEVTAVTLPKIKKKVKIYIITAVIVVIAIIVAVLVGTSIRQRMLEEEATQLSEEYTSNLETASYTMLLGAIDAESAGNLIKSVWYNAIYEERDTETDPYTRPNGYFVDDFNTALGNLFVDTDFQETISSIESNQTLVSGLMRDLTNPPEEYEEAYEALRELYSAYTDLTNMVINPSGSLQTFSQNFNSADSEFANCYDEMKLYIG